MTSGEESMKTLPRIGLGDVNVAYDGPEGDLWVLLMGHQIHVGGFKVSTDLGGLARDGKVVQGRFIARRR